MKELLCRAFCAALSVRQVPLGYAVQTPYENADGDPLLLYFVRHESDRHRWRIEDDGTQVPFLEASGVNLRGTRGEAFGELLTEYGASFDNDARTVVTPFFKEEDLGRAAVRFVGLLLRLQDLALLDTRTVRSTFRDDALAAIHQAFDGKAEVEEAAPVSDEFKGYEADVVLRSKGLPPLAVFLATSEERALLALVLKMETEKYRSVDSRVVLLLERSKDNPVKESTYALAQSRLDGVLSFRGAEHDAMARLSRVFATGSHVLQ